MLAIVTALSSEARPLIDHLGLQKIEAPFPIYHHDDVFLIVSGIGKLQAATSVSFLQAKYLSEKTPWLNVGLVGHFDLDVGTGMLIHKIVDQGSNISFYPSFPFSLPVRTETLYTVDKPEELFVEQGAFDMEASGFFAAAHRFTSSDMIHCYKIVSDNPLISFCKKEAASLVIPHIDFIVAFAKQLLHRAPKPLPHIPIEPFLKQLHFTATQEVQLRKLLRNLSLFEEIYPSIWLKYTSSRALLIALQEQLTSHPVLCSLSSM